VTPSSRVRLDAIARYLQDVAADDVADVGVGGIWVVRRVALVTPAFPSFNDEVELSTFCSGMGAHVAERRTTIRVGGDTAIEAVAIWVHVNADGRPTPLEQHFLDHFAPTMRVGRVSTRLTHPAPQSQNGGTTTAWPLRTADLDVVEHVNNAVGWAAVEDAIALHAPDRRIAGAEIEYRASLDRGDTPALHSVVEGDRLSCWITVDGAVKVSALVDLR
jgi:acyl-ACP thioesterase